jgi:hypothetical protein
MSFIRDGKSRAETRRRNYKTTDPETGAVTLQQALTAPPRRLSLLSRFYILISGWQTNMGFCFAGVGLLLLILGLRIHEKESAREASGGTWQTVVATIDSVSVEKAKEQKQTQRVNGKERVVSVDNPENDSYVYRYTYTVAEKEYKASARFGLADHQKLNKATADTILIEYFSTEHGYSNIVGYRSTGFSGVFIFIGFVFSLAGLPLLLMSLRKRAKTLQLYLRGLIAWGQQVSRTDTNAKINDLAVFKYVYNFIAENGDSYQAIAKAPADFNVGDQCQELVLYLAEDPSYNIIFDAVDSAPIVKEDGSLSVKQKIGSWFSFILCIVFVYLAIAAPINNM